RDSDAGQTAALDGVAAAAAGVELVAALASDSGYRTKGVATPLQEQPWGAVNKLVMVAGTAAPVGIYALNRLRGERTQPGWAIAASVALLAGSFMMRAAILHAGNASAKRPRDYFRLTRREARRAR